MWQYALWGAAGAAANTAVVFLEATTRSKGWPWRQPNGPGGGVYLVSVLLHVLIGGVVASAAVEATLISNAALAFGLGTVAPVVVKKLGRYALAALPSSADDEDQDDPEERP